ncbi:ribosome biogenesis protein BRX1 homolog isoform X2 [Cryptotermes secundus]|uniref:ribosome biogenesis protein BRX1 homolog isoform X2 n=1 Tax=Cryptotermes secundus TaxID=105785 RepID=UPI000CD7CA7C|nr:ribosome biogenesis protein BRX1 homolog isoform X2 [Cryptotermes secundus]
MPVRSALRAGRPLRPRRYLVKWINKQRVLIFGSRGISHRDRHLMQDLRALMPHSKPESKMERKDDLFVVNEICEMKNCNKCILFEGRLKRDLYMWIANIPSGPSAKFLVENVYTMAELKFNGNCLKGSRPILSFDENFTRNPHYILLKELFVQIFGTPYHHPKSQPFIDHVITFSVVDSRIWFRNFQILSEDGALAEIGPRFVLNPIKIFGGSFRGQAIWENPKFVSPAMYRQQIRKIAAHKYENRLENKMTYEESRPKESYQLNPIDEIFSGDTLEKASEIETQALVRKVKELETPALKNNQVRSKKKKSEVKELETPTSKKNRVKLKKKKSKQLKDLNKQDKKLKPKKTHKQGKKFKKWKGTTTTKKCFINQKAAPVEM